MLYICIALRSFHSNIKLLETSCSVLVIFYQSLTIVLIKNYKSQSLEIGGFKHYGRV